MKSINPKIAGIVLALCSYEAVHSQATKSGLGPLGHSATNIVTEYTGWDAGTNIPLKIMHRNPNQSIRFTTGGGALGINRMIIQSQFPAATAGFVGIGTNFLTPNDLLDVDNGHIDVNTNIFSYKINNNSILWHKGSTNNLFVGVGAGASHPFTTALDNTFIGNNAGQTNTFGNSNTFVGGSAGQGNTVDDHNTYIGFQAGISTVPGTAHENVFVGFLTGGNASGFHNTYAGNISGQNSSGANNSFYGIGSGNNNAGSENCFFGASAGANATASQNVFMGNNAGLSGIGGNNVAVGYNSAAGQTTGSDNTYVGSLSAQAVTTGAANTFIGANANSSVGAINNSSAFGANAIVVTDDDMILGNNSIRAGIGMSGIAGGPQNRLEINETTFANSNTANPNTTPNSFGASGLRFTKLNRFTTTIPNPGTGVLALDDNGDVIYVTGSSGSALGNLCGSTQNPIPSPGWEVPLGGNTFNFTSVASNAPSQVNIGFPACTASQGRLNVQTDVHRFAGTFINNNGFAPGFNCVGVGGVATSLNTNAIGVRGNAQNAPAGNYAAGVEGQANANTSTAGQHIGVSGNASNGVVESFGGSFEVITGTNPSPRNVGVRGHVDAGSTTSDDIGGAFTVRNIGQNKKLGVVGGINTGAVLTSPAIAALPSGIAIGVYGFNPLPNPPAPTSPATFLNWAGYFEGDVRIMGNGYVSGNTGIVSDKRFKTNIVNMEDALSKLLKVNGYTYDFKTEEFKDFRLPYGKQNGFIAQELKEIFPNVVMEGPGGYNYVNYTAMIPVLVEAIKEQQKQINEKTGVNSEVQKQLDEQKKINEALQSKMDKLEQMINACCTANSTGAKTSKGQAVNLSDKNVIVLNQNVPNPFAENTVISYSIPNDFTKAQIMFNTADGKVIKVVDINEKGEGHLNVFANDLSNGMYSYSLVVDGKIIDTKKMVKQN